jgi:hypothetical protein
MAMAQAPVVAEVVPADGQAWYPQRANEESPPGFMA